MAVGDLPHVPAESGPHWGVVHQQHLARRAVSLHVVDIDHCREVPRTEVARLHRGPPDAALVGLPVARDHVDPAAAAHHSGGHGRAEGEGPAPAQGSR